MDTQKKLPRAADPAAVGVDAAQVLALYEDLIAEEKEFHSFMVVRHGEVAAECYRAPCAVDVPQNVFSVSKTVTAIAVCFAFSEGLLHPEDAVIRFFPECVLKHRDPYIGAMTVRHLLTMTAGKVPNLLSNKGKINWFSNFLDAPRMAPPGERFRYTNENCFMLAAIITRVTGMSVRDYLQPRLFEPLGIRYPFWELNPDGIEAGGWGIYLTAEDMAKIALFLLHKGEYAGKQLLAAKWIVEATSVQSDNGFLPQPDDRAGYGYCLWFNSLADGSFRANGMFGQYAMVFPQYDAVFIIQSAVPIQQPFRDVLWRHLPVMFRDVPAAPAVTHDMQAAFAAAALERPLAAPRNKALEIHLNDRKLRFRKQLLLNLAGFPMSMLPLCVTYMLIDRAGNINDLYFRFQEDACTITWTEGDESNTLLCGMDGQYRESRMVLGGIEYKVLCYAYWTDEKHLFVSIRPYETAAGRTLVFCFHKGEHVTMTPKCTPKMGLMIDFVAESAEHLFDIPLIIRLCKLAIHAVEPFVEPRHRGRMKKTEK